MSVNAYEKKHLSLLRTLAPECMVLLKSNGDFPLAEPGKVALFGSGARQTIKGGTGSGDVNSRYVVNVETGLEQAGFTVMTRSWLDAYDKIREEAKAAFIESIKEKARKEHKLAVMVGMGAVMPEPAYELPIEGEADTAIYVLGRISGEGNDRNPIAGDFFLTETEIRDINAAAAKYKKFMLVLNVGGPVDLAGLENVENILVLSQLGAVTGIALADVLLGKRYPSGKLSTTWTACQDYCSIGEFGNEEDTRYTEGVYVGYRYFDSVEKDVTFPFGFGLSYTTFALGEAAVSLEGTRAKVCVPVTNTGSFPGKEVVQVYVSAPWGRFDQPYQVLAGFAKTPELAPGASADVEICFGLEDLATYDTLRASLILENGDYVVRVGNSSRENAAAAVIRLPETVIVRRLSNIGGHPDFVDWRPENSRLAAEDNTGLPVIEADPDAFGDLIFPEPPELSQRALDIASEMSDSDLAYVVIGNFSGGGVASVIGNASSTVAGAAGETTVRFPNIPTLVMADGPAGLRLTKDYVRDDKGVHAVGDTLPAGMAEFLPKPALTAMKLMNRTPKGEKGHQYCTAIPIGTALAQSWNMDLCETCGDIVGDEMKRFGVHLWLAPAFNIHRSPLCGRNFEYCSEDPLLSGAVGAAITKGVQMHEGCSTTIKHFCCNNQETNRFRNNSMVSERALRTIYLKPFEICIREADPHSLMTSYNLLNGTHTSERADLLKTVLREEWGWTGMVMSDWVISAMSSGKQAHRMALAAQSIKAGNDIFMPGGKGDYQGVLRALKGKNKDCVLTREELEYCAAHVIDLCLTLTGQI